MRKKAVILGAGPAGLTAALELVRQSDIQPIVLEAGDCVGGISRTVRYNGNRMDIGGHRFFSKSDKVMRWWLELMPVEHEAEAEAAISYQNKTRHLPMHERREGEDKDLVMLVRPRKSEIYFMRQFFDYPLSLSGPTLRKLGPVRLVRIGFSYLSSRLFPIKQEKSLRDFLVNRFGSELYLTFFKSYTEKVWGVPCEEISAEWGAQRIKGLSLTAAVKHFLKKTFGRTEGDIGQKKTETSLIEQFLYPKFGPGQLWEHVAGLVQQGGGELHMGWRAVKINTEGDRVVSVEAVNRAGERQTFAGDHFFSTVPVRELVHSLDVEPPANVVEVADGLQYRDFITIGLLVDKLQQTEPDGSLLKDTWIYIQEPDVQIGRLQIFNNWSPYLVADPSKVWLGLEYFCYDTDPLWKMSDEELKAFGAMELEKIGMIRRGHVRDGHVVRVPKTYPAYFGSYGRFDEIRRYMDRYENLFLVGRNGMHKYNNQDHSMLTAMAAVDAILAGETSKSSLWDVNTEQEYHEEK
ncbi:NAD(P)/FAD-dependent oxidoreductase [Terriglobus albidus]|uniref:NAD(P)/FAD-dependent oxidoreductase n=1 Tax=Terriglobus albidus TaxID=1592106 RepID=A0A5B9EJI1_9BACT|nr:NAD(P)/FAD-dependent oxidoreductase [Terriglobus albidus]QEE31050.1 NAD(P)/FAD-dependent oxidoreductase [Terriglobus albidus]